MNDLKTALILRAQNGDVDAFDRLVNENTGLVRSIALRFTGRGVDFEDLCQIGHIGMIKAIKNFDLSRETAFSTYAVPLIIGEIKRFLRDDGEIKVGREIKRRGAILMSAREKYITQNGCEPSVSELAVMCGLSDEDAVEALGACSPTVSLSEQVGEDTSLSRIIRLLEDAAATKAPIARVADRVSAVFVPAVMAISAVTLAAWLIATQNAEQALRSAISVLVIS